MLLGSLQWTMRTQVMLALSIGKIFAVLSLPPTSTQLVQCEKGKFCLDGSFSKNAPYKQKIILFHLGSIDQMKLV